MELSLMCLTDVLIVVSDPKKKRLTYFSSSREFDLAAARRAEEEAMLPQNLPNFERFTNADYQTVCELDFRSVRYRR